MAEKACETQNQLTKSLKLMPGNELNSQIISHFNDMLRFNQSLKRPIDNRKENSESDQISNTEAYNAQEPLIPVQLKPNVDELVIAWDILSKKIRIPTSKSSEEILSKLFFDARYSLVCYKFNSQDISYLFMFLSYNRNLKSLMLSHNKIDSDGTKVIAEALANNCLLEELYLEMNPIKAAGVEYIANALKRNTSLKKLNLNETKIGDKGAQYLAKALAFNSSLTMLGVSNNDINDLGAKDLAESLKYNSSLTELWLAVNKIGTNGAKAFAEAFIHNSTLTIILLNNNKIGNEGAKAISGSLPHNVSLTLISLSNNEIDISILSSFEPHLNKNKKITSKLAITKQYWPAAALVMCGVAANNSHVLKFSFLPLTRMIVEMTQKVKKEDLDKIPGTIDRFTKTLFFTDHVNMQALKLSVQPQLSSESLKGKKDQQRV